ncbi:hypothetical protein [Pseudomonas sp. NPDC007930]|uniref:DUF7740 domain-containing protein n=1 Tax=Pseudomonas sp. NPDC007930 TaxID=3364417 RepID=UPI0036E9929D
MLRTLAQRFGQLAPSSSKAPAYSLTDAFLSVSLAMAIHGNEKAVADTARRVAKKLPRAKREMMYDIVNSPSPVGYVSELLRSAPLRHL